MSQNVVCKKCGEIHPHKALGYCSRCYLWQPHIKQHIVNFRQKEDYTERRRAYDVRYILKNMKD
jgi:predicted ATP-dependent serine protease